MYTSQGGRRGPGPSRYGAERKTRLIVQLLGENHTKSLPEDLNWSPAAAAPPSRVVRSPGCLACYGAALSRTIAERQSQKCTPHRGGGVALKSVWFPSRTIHPPPPARDTEPKEKHVSLCSFWEKIMRNPYRKTSTGAQLPSPPRPVWSSHMRTSLATEQHRAAPLLRGRGMRVHLTGGAAWR